jgi:RNA polymerase sigma-70 factor, ECF subfamily
VGTTGDDAEDGWALVERARSGDRDAFGELFERHYAAVFRVARSRLPDALAEDAAAETFTRAWAALPRYKRTGAPFVAWLYGIARNVAADAARRASRSDGHADLEDRPHDPWVRHAEERALADALAALPEEQRQVIELKYLVGLTNDEVGAALGKKPGAVNAQQWRALRALQRELGSG